MSINDLAREHTTQQRQHDEQRQETVLSRAEEELETPEAQPDEIREQVTDQRLHEEHLHETVLSRAEEAVDC